MSHLHLNNGFLAETQIFKSKLGPGTDQATNTDKDWGIGMDTRLGYRLIVIGMGLSILLMNLTATATVTSGGGNDDNFTQLPAPESDMLLEWDYHLGHYRYIFTEGRSLDEDDVTIEVKRDGGGSETLATAFDNLHKDGDLIIGNSTIEPSDDEQFTITVVADGETLAEREFETSGEEFVPTVGKYSYEMEMEMVESAGDYTMSMEMDLIAEVETTDTYELVLMEGQVSMDMEDEGMELNLQGPVEQMSKESDGETVDSSMSMDLDGTFSYNDGWISMDGDAVMRMAEEDQMSTDQYMLMDGEWEGLGESGDFYSEEKTLRFENHDNHDGDSYDCMVQESYTMMTMGSDKNENFTTSWNVREAGFSNTTIYYEYEEKENGDTTEEGSEYPENSPVPDEEEFDLLDVMELEGATPVVPVIGDVFVGRSETEVDFAIRYEVTSAKGKTVGGQTYNTLIITGVAQGDGDGTGLIYVAYDDRLFGLTLYQETELSWSDQTLSASYTLVQAQVPESEDDDDDEFNILLLLIPLAIAVAVVGTLFVLRNRSDAMADVEEPWEQPVGTPQAPQATQATQATQSIQPQAQVPQYGPQGGHAQYMPGQPYAAQAAPAAAQLPTATCPFCFSAAGFQPQYGYYYCHNCAQYLQL